MADQIDTDQRTRGKQGGPDDPTDLPVRRATTT
jgi:hypothetical protein